jgi:hypothetical protein
MRLSSLISALTLVGLASTGAVAADWSNDTVGYKYYAAQSEPGTAEKVGKNVLNFTHVSGDKLGMNLFSIDYLRSDNADPANGGGQGAAEYYGFYKRSFSLSAMSENKTGYGYFKDLSLTARIDLGAKNTAFAPSPTKLRIGMDAAMPVSGGFWNIGFDVYSESNNNSFAAASDRAVKFTPALALSSAWAIPVAGIATFDGFLDIVGPKGNDGFGVATTTETLLEAHLMFDVGGAKSGMKMGAGFQYWNNKFGCNNDTATVANSCKATSPMLLATYQF